MKFEVLFLPWLSKNRRVIKMGTIFINKTFVKAFYTSYVNLECHGCNLLFTLMSRGKKQERINFFNSIIIKVYFHFLIQFACSPFYAEKIETKINMQFYKTEKLNVAYIIDPFCKRFKNFILLQIS